MKKRVLVCLTGASGAIYGFKVVRALKELGHEVHLIISKWGKKTLEFELDMQPEALENVADCVYDETDLTAGPASGSYRLDSMIIAPCSMKTLAGIAHGYADNLIARAADCSLKEKRPLVLLVRETPMNLIHIRNLAQVTEAGAVVFPASPAFWHKPKTIDELVDSLVDRMLTHLKAKSKAEIEWQGED
ncbi:MAG: UbiX family flavin prenyltransferase [Candidatus Thorarchaeota archaeon]|jgi:polyprenyl P-hydroxybenzoate/phenylacrylic acid decarboxylase-like protein